MATGIFEMNSTQIDSIIREFLINQVNKGVLKPITTVLHEVISPFGRSVSSISP
jgi:hypothetical protein